MKLSFLFSTSLKPGMGRPSHGSKHCPIRQSGKTCLFGHCFRWCLSVVFESWSSFCLSFSIDYDLLFQLDENSSDWTKHIVFDRIWTRLFRVDRLESVLGPPSSMFGHRFVAFPSRWIAIWFSNRTNIRPIGQLVCNPSELDKVVQSR